MELIINGRWIMKKILAAILILLSLPVFSPAYGADWTPVQLSLFHPIQLYSEKTDVQGLRLNLVYGLNENVSGLDIGIVNQVVNKFKGAQVGAFPFGGANFTKELSGLQLAGFFGGINIATGKTVGMQVSGTLAGINYAGDVTGAQISGLLVGVNVAKNVKGLQACIVYNQAESMQGLQIGLVNYCMEMKGIQIGLVNIIEKGRIPFLPIVNAQF
jgi:hypothetical protein